MMMKASRLALATIVLVLASICSGQESGPDVDNLTLETVSSTLTRLNWVGPPSIDCKILVTYSIFRGTSEDFQPSARTRIATGISKTTYLAKEPLPNGDYYYSVRADATPVSCSLHSGHILTYPLDLGQAFSITVGADTTTCTARSTSELDCPAPLPDFHAVIASQAGHEYVIGCRSADYEMGAWTCVNLTSAVYHIGVHSQTLTVWDSGMMQMNSKTGKKVAPITPVFSMLSRIK
jgi:hypothetical protein